MLIGLWIQNQRSEFKGLKVQVLTRIGAKLIDLFLVVFVGAIPFIYPIGPLLGFGYSLAGDGMNFGPFQGQSVGKKLLKLRVINKVNRQPATFRDSILRNAPVGVATFFAIIPVWGWIVSILVGLPLMLMEIYLMLSVEAGHRLGDVMGDTEVVEGKNASSQVSSDLPTGLKKSQ